MIEKISLFKEALVPFPISDGCARALMHDKPLQALAQRILAHRSGDWDVFVSAQGVQIRQLGGSNTDMVQLKIEPPAADGPVKVLRMLLRGEEGREVADASSYSLGDLNTVVQQYVEMQRPRSLEPSQDGLEEERSYRDPGAFRVRITPLATRSPIEENGTAADSLDALCDEELQRRLGNAYDKLSKRKKRELIAQIAYSASNRDSYMASITLESPWLQAQLGQDEKVLTTCHRLAYNSPLNGRSYKQDDDIVQIDYAPASSNDRTTPVCANMRSVCAPDGRAIAYAGTADTRDKVIEQVKFLFLQELKAGQKGIANGEGGAYTFTWAIYSACSTSILWRQERRLLEREIEALGMQTISFTDGTTNYTVRLNPILVSKQQNFWSPLETVLHPSLSGQARSQQISTEGLRKLVPPTEEAAAFLKALQESGSRMVPEQALLTFAHLCDLCQIPLVCQCKSSVDRTGVNVSLLAAFHHWKALGQRVDAPSDIEHLLRRVEFKELFAANLLAEHRITQVARDKLGFYFAKGAIQQGTPLRMLPERYLTPYSKVKAALLTGLFFVACALQMAALAVIQLVTFRWLWSPQGAFRTMAFAVRAFANARRVFPTHVLDEKSIFVGDRQLLRHTDVAALLHKKLASCPRKQLRKLIIYLTRAQEAKPTDLAPVDRALLACMAQWDDASLVDRHFSGLERKFVHACQHSTLPLFQAQRALTQVTKAWHYPERMQEELAWECERDFDGAMEVLRTDIHRLPGPISWARDQDPTGEKVLFGQQSNDGLDEETQFIKKRMEELGEGEVWQRKLMVLLSQCGITLPAPFAVCKLNGGFGSANPAIHRKVVMGERGVAMDLHVKTAEIQHAGQQVGTFGLDQTILLEKAAATWHVRVRPLCNVRIQWDLTKDIWFDKTCQIALPQESTLQEDDARATTKLAAKRLLPGRGLDPTHAVQLSERGCCVTACYDASQPDAIKLWEGCEVNWGASRAHLYGICEQADAVHEAFPTQLQTCLAQENDVKKAIREALVAGEGRVVLVLTVEGDATVYAAQLGVGGPAMAFRWDELQRIERPLVSSIKKGTARVRKSQRLKQPLAPCQVSEHRLTRGENAILLGSAEGWVDGAQLRKGCSNKTGAKAVQALVQSVGSNENPLAFMLIRRQ